MTTSEPRWLQLLREAVAASTISAVAQRLDYSRTSISLVLAGKYPGATAKIEARALAVLEPKVVVFCPYARQELPVAQCNEIRARRAPTHNPMAMGQWRACQKCQNNCKGDGK